MASPRPFTYRNPPKIPVEITSTPLNEVQGSATGLIGTFIILGSQLLIAALDLDRDMLANSLGLFGELLWNGRFPLILFVAVLAMIWYEIQVRRVHLRNYRLDSPRELDHDAWRRIWTRWCGLLGFLIISWILYTGLQWYDMGLFLSKYLQNSGFEFFQWVGIKFGEIFGDRPGLDYPQFSQFFLFFLYLTPVLLIGSIFYYRFHERYAIEMDPEHDEMLVAGEVFKRIPKAALYLVQVPLVRFYTWVTSDAPSGFIQHAADHQHEIAWRAASPYFSNMFRAWGVKFFFVPMMVSWYIDHSHNMGPALQDLLRPYDHSVVETSFRFFAIATTCIFLLDVALAAIGYILTLRILDTHVRSAEPTAFGWMVALAAYPPINHATGAIFSYGAESSWKPYLHEYPWVYALWAVLICGLYLVYVSGTVAFGLRFSNLTNRGIIMTGPYRFIRHPAYISKNLAWWLGAMPFWLAPGLGYFDLIGNCLRLLCVNLIYFLRAITEEAHLAQDPKYREYCEKVKYRFIPGIW